MKKYIFIIALILKTFTSFGQWTYKVINSDFDGKFKKAYTQIDNRGWLMMEVSGTDEGKPFLYLAGSYFCDKYTTVDMVFVVNGEKHLYNLDLSKSDDSRTYYFSDGIWTDDFTKHFREASKCLIRVNQEHCTDEYYTFNMSGSSAAYNFIVK